MCQRQVQTRRMAWEMCEEERKREGHTGESESAGASEGSQSLPGANRRTGVSAGQSGRMVSMIEEGPGVHAASCRSGHDKCVSNMGRLSVQVRFDEQ